MSRTLVVGDIHGALKALKQVLERVKINKNDHLIFLGDYVDGWSDTAKTIDYLIKLKASHNCTFIRGNHDELCYDWLKTGKNNPMWLYHGGQTTVDSYQNVGKDIRQIHIDFLEELENYFLDTKKRLFIHAGYTNLHGVAHEYYSRMFYWDRTLWEMALSIDPAITESDRYYPKRLIHYKEIYIGHTPVTRIGKETPVKAANVWNIDTGAAFKGPLTIMDVDSKKFWQSDAVYKLYPDENGRN